MAEKEGKKGNLKLGSIRPLVIFQARSLAIDFLQLTFSTMSFFLLRCLPDGASRLRVRRRSSHPFPFSYFVLFL